MLTLPILGSLYIVGNYSYVPQELVKGIGLSVNSIGLLIITGVCTWSIDFDYKLKAWELTMLMVWSRLGGSAPRANVEWNVVGSSTPSQDNSSGKG